MTGPPRPVQPSASSPKAAGGTWLALVVFCLLATSSFVVMELYAAFAPAAAGARFAQIHTWINTHQDQAIVVASLAVGAWLLGQPLLNRRRLTRRPRARHRLPRLPARPERHERPLPGAGGGL
jgi:hypothetical protein